ncbi:Structural maintenance of chromosomes protein 5 [Malassezia yamatoensis]|uniref:Structural maintenance of chromosomes protein 5 n=1 Tax=Malassezia yamatoensis TaxID=253288 RepID=A0AAJ5YRS1_9BASI|nr:Structural maintenance of chromosomes protein 5 [Malassezia yamatoensis]
MVLERSHRRTKRRREDDDEHIGEGQETTEHISDALEDAQRSLQAASTSSHSQSAHVEDSAQTMPGADVRDRGSSGYIAGSIVRLACENFVTYDAVEFFPGPHLNMIIGPNGTGKSTVVCAIALGLGWKPSVLGRAKDIASYVKLGHQQGWVEIELQGLQDGPNLTVRRVLFRESNSSDWLLNGRMASAREVHQAISQFHIEVGNLCTFLPQDRVADFASMTPARLLQETQHAAGDARLSEWHADLIIHGQQLSSIKTRIERDEQERSHLEERNQVLERDVRRYEQRVELEKQVAILNARIPYAQYREAKQRYDRARSDRSLAKQTVREIETAMEPIKEQRERIEQNIQKLDLRTTEQRKEAESVHVTMKRILHDREQGELEMAGLHEQEKLLEQAESNRQNLIIELQLKISELEKQTERAPTPTTSSQLDSELRTVKSALRTIAEDMRENEIQRTDLMSEERRLLSRRQQAEQRLTQLDNVRHQRIQILAQADQDTYKAIQWLASHRELFQKEIYDPVLVLLDVKQPDAARAIESCLNWNIQRTFVCQCRADYDLFTRELIDKRGWRLNVVELEGGRALEAYTSPMSVDDLHSIGFDDYAINLVDAPSDVLRYLCQAAHFHLIPIAARSNVDAEIVERNGQFQRYIIGTTIFTTLLSKYGKRLPVTQSRELKPLRNFAHSAQSEAREQAGRDLALVTESLERLSTRKHSLESTHSAKKEEYRQLSEKREQLAEQQREAQQILNSYRKARAVLDAERQKLRREETRAPISLQRKTIAEQRRKCALELGKLAERMLRSINSLMHSREEYDVLMLKSITFASQLSQLTGIFREHQSKLRDAHHVLEQTLMTFTQVKEETLACKRRYERRMEESDDAFRDLFRDQFAEDVASVDQLELELQSAQAALDIPWGVGPNVVEAFQQRKAKIAQLNGTIDAALHEKVQAEAKIERIEQHWLPALEQLICKVNERFSSAFQRLGCAGEIRLARDDDYEKWGIDVLVKFRDTEPLKLLTGQRQSGGERSLSTILYLLSLTELSRSPFSLVDEINQGMDRRAERAVHNQMVAITCRSEASQYFLITPKLLSGLQYHPLMKVLLINNGDWLPERLNLINNNYLLDATEIFRTLMSHKKESFLKLGFYLLSFFYYLYRYVFCD